MDLIRKFGAQARGRGMLGALLAMSCATTQAQVAVEVVQPRQTQVAQTLQLTGTVTAERDAALSPRISGLVETLNVDAGDQVKRGATLLVLDSALARLTLERTDAALDEGRTRLAEATRLRDEAKTLSTRGDIPQSQYRTREAEVKLAEAAVARLDAERREQAERVARHTLPAPFDGVIRRRLTDPGEWIETGTPVLELVAIKPLRIDVQVPQRHLAALTEQTPVQVRLDARSDETFTGRVVARVPASDPATRTFLVRVGVDGAATGAAPGMSARLSFELSRDTSALIVPRDAVKRYPDGTTTVWVIRGTAPELTAEEIPIELGQGSGRDATVIDGLSADQAVVVRGNETLRANEPVRVQRAKPD